MVDVTIYSKNGIEKAVVKSIEYDGTFMGDRYVTVSIESPTVIDWAIGDYLVYRGERWSLWLLPATSKVARVSSYGGAIEYKDLRFCPTEEELRRCSFLDVVLHDNEIHYTSLPNFSFYCATAKDLADRIQANLNRLYPGQWQVTANPAVSITDQSLTFSNNNCWEALAMANTSLGLNFTVDSANREIVIGGEGAFIETVMEYGKGNGLKSVERTVDDNQQVVNRLYAYGNTRNIPYRYYNKRYAEGTSVFDMVQSMYLPNLMLPGICRGWAASSAEGNLDNDGCTHESYGEEGQKLSYNSSLQRFENPDGTAYTGARYRFWKHWSLSTDRTMYYCDRVWLDSVESIDACGIQEGVKFFDGSDELVDDIYPSITGFESTEDLAEALGQEAATAQNLSYEQGELYAILGADVESWDGIIPEEQETTPTFYIRIKNIGFDLSDAELDASGDTPRLSMKSGMCTGREFNILECKKQVYSGGAWADYNASSPVAGPWSYYLKCEVAADDSIGQYFPNDSFALAEGDKFVILGIKMPDVYVDVAENRLLKAAIVWLSESDKTAYNYSPAINNIYMAENPETSALLKEGNVLHIFDEDLGIDVEMTISQIKIKNDKQIPEYEVTLSNDKEADLVQRVTAQVQQTYGQFLGSGGKGGGSGIYLIGVASNTAPTDNNAYSARRSLNMFLRKNADDAASGKITFNGGSDTKQSADFTDYRGYLSGWLGYGARISGDGNAEFEGVNIRGSLKAAELIFNQILASGGEEIKSVGYGEIETVSPLGNVGTATLKLDGNEWPTIKVGDYCRGLYNTVGKDYDNASISEEEDNNGFRKKKGFFSSYFQVLSIQNEGKGVCKFMYTLQTENGVAVTEHPCPLMKFAVYGNSYNTNKDRQSSIYTTAIGIAPRTLFLAGVNDWKIKPENIKIAKGNINGIKVWEELSAEQAQQYDSSEIVTYTGSDNETHYKHLKELVGDAGFYCEDNIYLGGIIEQIRSIAAEEISAQVSHIGEAWIKSNPSDRYVVDCYEDGTAMDSHQFTITVNLYFGSEICNLDGLNCWVDDGESSGQPSVSLDNKAAFYDVSIEQGDVISTRMITFTLSGSLNGETYNMVKTIAIVANRQGVTGSQGEQGDDGLGAVYIDTNEEYFVVPCDSQGKASARTEMYLEASLKVGDEDATLKQSGGQCNINYNGHSYFFLFNGNLAYKTLTVSAGTTPADTLTITLKGTYEGTEYTKTKKIHVIAQRQGEQGDNGIKGSFKATAFKRTNSDIRNTTPIGGDYDDPIPTDWSDGIPDGGETLWATNCTFNGDGTDSGWSNPRKMTDTATYDVEFSPNEICPDDPSDVISERQSQGWYDPDASLPDGLTWGQMIWRAERECKNGDWGQWIKLKIKGENGEGVGIASITTYYLRTIKYQGVTVSDFGTQTEYLLPTAELPYLWRYTHVLYTDNSSYNSNPELIYTYSDRPNINLLDDTSFLDLDNMDAWSEKGVLANNTSTPLAYQVSATNGEFYVRYKGNGSAGEAGYINYLVQPIANKLSPSSWYTFSFEVYGGHLPPNVYSTKEYYLDLNMTGLFDSSVNRFIDGVASSSSNIVVHFTPTTSWVKHTVTFKTPSTIGDDVTTKWQMYTRKTDDYIILRKPKLEAGMVATEYISGNTSRQPMARTSTWTQGKAYFKGAIGESYTDIVALDSKWYKCLKSHTSNDDNKPQEGRATTYWQPADSFNFIATDLLLADQAVIRLLFSQKILMSDENGQLTATINDDGLGSYCIHYPESGNKKFEFSQTKDIVCYNDNDDNTVAWRIGASGLIERSQDPSWSKVWLNLRTTAIEPSDNSFYGDSNFVLTAYPEYISGDNGVQAENGKIYKANHDYADGPNGNYIDAGWYTKYERPIPVLTTDGTDLWEIEVIHIVNGQITQRKMITTNRPNS